jgi:sugar lactone lactonase YvrE
MVQDLESMNLKTREKLVAARRRFRRRVGWAALAALMGMTGSAVAEFPFLWWGDDEVRLEVEAQLDAGPGGMTITPKGSFIVSLHQYYKTNERVVEITPEGEVLPFPEQLQPGSRIYPGMELDSVLVVQSDADGIVWMLDNGRRNETTPKLVAWDTDEDRLHKVIFMPAPYTRSNSFLNDLALDPVAPFVYITDPAAGGDAALIVVDLRNNMIRRVLEGHFSVIPEKGAEVRVDGRPVEVTRLDGTRFEPQAGANPIATDRKGKFLYFGPMKGHTLYRVSTEYLRDANLSPADLASQVEVYAAKPVCDGISIDSRGNIYVSDIGRGAIGVIDVREKQYSIHISDPMLSWPDGPCFGTDGKLYFYTNQLHRSAIYNGGKNSIDSPFMIFKVKGLAPGSVGR